MDSPIYGVFDEVNSQTTSGKQSSSSSVSNATPPQSKDWVANQQEHDLINFQREQVQHQLHNFVQHQNRFFQINSGKKRVLDHQSWFFKASSSVKNFISFSMVRPVFLANNEGSGSVDHSTKPSCFKVPETTCGKSVPGLLKGVLTRHSGKLARPSTDTHSADYHG